MVSTLTGLVYPLRLLIAEAPDKRKTFRKGIAYTVVDATSPETQDQYQGDWPAADSAGHLKAIQRALDDFGDDATYGEGLIVVRIPPPSHDQQEHSRGRQPTPRRTRLPTPIPARRSPTTRAARDRCSWCSRRSPSLPWWLARLRCR